MRYVIKDHICSTRLMLNENNDVIACYDYDAFGNQVDKQISEDISYTFTGQEYDEETGLYNYKARMYDSMLMRFYSVDPAEEQASPYAYCANNPIIFTDPTGCEIKVEGSDEDVNKAVKALNDEHGAGTFYYDKKEGKIKTKKGLKKEDNWSEQKKELFDIANDKTSHSSMTFTTEPAAFDKQGNDLNSCIVVDTFDGVTIDGSQATGNNTVFMESVEQIAEQKAVLDRSAGELVGHVISEGFRAAQGTLDGSVSKHKPIGSASSDPAYDYGHDMSNLTGFRGLDGYTVVNQPANFKDKKKGFIVTIAPPNGDNLYFRFDSERRSKQK